MADAPVDRAGENRDLQARVPPSFAADRYVVKRLLGEGSRKRVYLAHDSRLERDVALAVIKTEGLDEAGLTRVRREARAMGRLGDHPHLVTIHDIGEESGQPYIVTQYLAGGSLEDLLRRSEKQRLPVDQALRLADQICQALEHAHRHGVVHRDLKPGNVWLATDGSAKLGDFGLALAKDRSRLTLEGMMVGTVVYMPPEQALGRAADARSDLYALGVLLYEMVTGRPPFLGDDAVAIISQHINTRPVAPSWHNEEVPRALEALILRLLAKASEDRPESAAAVRAALAGISTTRATGGRAAREEANPLDRLASGVFVGREREMDELCAALEETLSGRGRLVMLVGEPGIGKTRTAEELATYARLRKVQILWGRCYEGEGAPAYWPWVQAIRAYVHDREPSALRSEMGSGAADIAEVVSEVRQRLPGVPAPPTLEPEQARFRLFDSITTFLRNAAKERPLVLVLDDLHSADKPSLLLLQFLARELRAARLLVLGTYRDVELSRQHPLSPTLAELAREQLSQRILLRGLAQHDVARFIEITAGLKPPETLVEAVFRETEGNPFFVNEVVRLLVTDGRLEHPEKEQSWSMGIPQSVREVVGRRLDRLSPECNRVLTIAAVIGREFGLDALERVSGLGGDRLLEVLDEAVDARVLGEVPRPVRRYIFSHALIRETLYGELTTTRRVRLHRQVGEALEGLYGAKPDVYVAELAHHFFQAARGGDIRKAIDYAGRAGERATRLLAYEEAAAYYQQALQALELEAETDETARCDLLLALGGAQARTGDTTSAKETFLLAAASARTLNAPERLARAALGFGGLDIEGFADAAGTPGRTDEVLVGLLEEALDALPTEHGSQRARMLGRLALALYWSGPGPRRESLSLEAVAIAERIGDPATLAAVLGMRRYALFGPETLEERLAMATEVLRLAEKTGDLEAAVEAQRWRLTDLLELGDVAGVDRAIEAHDRLARQLRQPLYMGYTAMFRAMRALMDGRFAEGEVYAEELRATGKRLRNVNLGLFHTAQMYWLRSEQGRLQDLQLSQSDITDQAAALPAARCGLTLTLCQLGLEEQARAEFESLAANDFADLPRDLTWLPAMTALVEVCAFLGDARRAALLYTFLLPYAARNIVVGTHAAFYYGPASYYLGRLAATTGREAEAAAHFEDALKMSEAMGARPFIAHAQGAYAAVLLARGERGRALTLLNRALDTARELGMKPLVEKTLALKLRAQGIITRDVNVSIDAVVTLVQRDRPDLRAHSAPDGTVTVLFTDIEGSTAMTERLGDERAREVIRAHNAIVRREVSAHGGFEVKSQGDGFMVVFRSARRALRCAIALQLAFRAHAERHPDPPLRVRAGLHTGEAIREANDFFGKAVILGARIAAAAQGGEILVSSMVRSLTEGTHEVRFGDPREVELKGLAGTHAVHPVAWG